jgi:4-diphosphocytidyl-2-C-methyl-D-erythritol kinase
MLTIMPVSVRSFAKINLGLRIGSSRPDGFHELRTVYQTIALHDVVRVFLDRGNGIEIRCQDPRVPADESNTCYRIVERAMAGLQARGRVVVEIEKRLPVQGGLGGASGNAVAVLLGLEAVLKKQLSGTERLRIAAEVGSDLPLFLVGGTVLGVGRGEEVYPGVDLPASLCVVALPGVGVSTARAFADWDLLLSRPGPESVALASPIGTNEGGSRPAGRGVARRGEGARSGIFPGTGGAAGRSKLTVADPSDRMTVHGREFSAWLCSASGVPVSKSRGRAETPLLDLVRTGIENDFERVVFPKYPELREVKRLLQRAGAFYASLSGSGSATYGLFASRSVAEEAVSRLAKADVAAVVTRTLTRRQYWKRFQVSSF